MRNRSITAIFILSSLLLLAALSEPSSSREHKAKTKDAVYVCACLQTKSCACMTEAKTEGPCSCGTEGGPPMKAVAPDSDWAKQNRDALAK